MQKIKKYKSIYLVNADPIKNAGFLKDYFINNTENFVSFHFFPAYSKRACYMEKYADGRLVQKKEYNQYKGNNVLFKNGFNYLSFLYTSIFQVKNGSYLITNAPIYCIGNSFLRIMKSFEYVLWIGDYYSQNKFPMNIYNKILDSFNKKLKYVIYLSPSLKKIYYNKKICKSNGEVITLGIKKMFAKKNSHLGKRTKLGFIGLIRKQQGLDLLFAYLAEKNNSELEVVGDGYYLSYYKNLAKKMKIQKKVKFYGSVEDFSNIFKKWDMGIALYENSEDNLSKYAEPTKIKDYLSYGLPVITTNATYFSKEVERYSAGIVINETTRDLDKAIDMIIKDYKKYLEGVDDLVIKYEYSKRYDNKFKFLTENETE